MSLVLPSSKCDHTRASKYPTTLGSCRLVLTRRGIRWGCFGRWGILVWILKSKILEVVSCHQVSVHSARQICLGEITTLAFVDALYLLDAGEVRSHGLLALACVVSVLEHMKTGPVLDVPS